MKKKSKLAINYSVSYDYENCGMNGHLYAPAKHLKMEIWNQPPSLKKIFSSVVKNVKTGNTVAFSLELNCEDLGSTIRNLTELVDGLKSWKRKDDKRGKFQ